MDNREFLHQQKAAVERMREMNARSTNKQNQNPKNNYGQTKKQRENSDGNRNPKSGSLNIPFLDKLTFDSDTTLIIGLLLILMSESSDKTLLFALMYILM